MILLLKCKIGMSQLENATPQERLSGLHARYRNFVTLSWRKIQIFYLILRHHRAQGHLRIFEKRLDSQKLVSILPLQLNILDRKSK